MYICIYAMSKTQNLTNGHIFYVIYISCSLYFYILEIKLHLVILYMYVNGIPQKTILFKRGVINKLI